MTSFPYRLFGAAALDVGVYEEVEADRSATLQAALVVIASSLAIGFGAYGLTGRTGVSLVAGALVWSALSLVGWAAWALLVFQVGGRLMPTRETRVDVTELLRTIGFSTAPGLLCILGIMPSVARPAPLQSLRESADLIRSGKPGARCALARHHRSPVAVSTLSTKLLVGLHQARWRMFSIEHAA